MSIDPYSTCPCGSGKKYKWCCSSYFPKVEQAIDLERNGQHESALKVLKELTQQHGDKPAVWVFYAQFLSECEQIDAAEEALSEALNRDPHFAMAHYLRGMLRYDEGEIKGAVILFRKAAEAFPPEAKEILADLYPLIGRCELRLHRYLAAFWAYQQALLYLPPNSDVRAELETLLNADSSYPACVRKPYPLRPTAKALPGDAASCKLSELKTVLEKLVQQIPSDPAAWFNLGLTQARLGESTPAIQSLLRSLELENDDYRAEETATLIELLRTEEGREQESDFVQYRVNMLVRDPAALVELFRQWANTGKLMNVQIDQDYKFISASVAEELPSLMNVGQARMAKVRARLIFHSSYLILWHTNRESLHQVVQELRDQLTLALDQSEVQLTPAELTEVALEAICYPLQNAPIEQIKEKLASYSRHFFEEVWIHKPFKALGGATLQDAVSQPALRKRALGLIKFMEDCYECSLPVLQIGETLTHLKGYDFSELRQKLGLEYVRAEPPAVVVVDESPSSAPLSFESMNAAELAALEVASLSVEQLEQAMRAALRRDAKDLAVAFAQAAVLKPFDPAHPDRYPLYACLIAGATAQGDLAKVGQLLEEGARYDAEHNDSRRATEYALRRAQYYTRAREKDKAVAEFENLIAQHPNEGKYYTTAAEAMLSLGVGRQALAFAERGLAKAQEMQSRDLEGHCRELIGAAKKMA